MTESFPKSPQESPRLDRRLVALTLTLCLVMGAARLFYAMTEPLWFDEDTARVQLRAAYERSFTPGSALRQFAAIVEAPDREAALATLAVPLLVMHGTLDPLVGMDGGERLAALVTGATFLPIEGLAHDFPVQVWQQVISAVTAHVSQHAS